ncbi:MAG: putative GTP-binding protein EngB [Myxococcota bacterium]|nr:putative GTP-binding protein EngB [Myxococcota bacterium]
MPAYKIDNIARAHHPGQFPRHALPEVAFAGASNVGKSSLLNALTGLRKNAARVSATPGRTQDIAFYAVEGKLCLVDLPGFGFAQVSRETRDDWDRLIQSYFKGRENLKLACLLMDCRRPPAERDRAVLDWLTESEIPTAIVLTKMDKLPKNRRDNEVRRFEKLLELEPDTIIPVSAQNREGVDDLWGVILDQCGVKLSRGR